MYGGAYGPKRWIFVGGVIIIAGVVVLWRAGVFSSLPAGSREVSALDVRSLPSVVVQNEAGGSLSLADVIVGKPAVVALWASWCPFCKDEFPKLKAMKEEFGDALVVVAVNRGESPEAVAESGAVSVLGANIAVVRDVDDALYAAVGGFSMPEIIFVDKDGKIREQWRGPIHEEELSRHIVELIGY
ncbi:MAG: TlpA disulfide reductase family protein [bacterium]|nr:TlpA disulfide reductase family protein [bacterium]MDZ4299767.1 TlpA disulfide reductase family protein [Candidatus Sungbacteria bacterium]